MFERLNTPAVANAGLAIGSTAVIAAIGYFFKVLSDPDELVGLYEAAKTHTDPHGAIARIAGAAIAIVGALVVGGLMAYQGKPSTIK